MSHSKVQIARCIAAMEATGHNVTALRLCDDGGILFLTERAPGALPSNDDGDWVSLAGQTEIPRAKGA